ncbi:MAG TPA: hypothetical protein VF784_09155 [Anaerolineales bacterium]
MPPVKPPEPKHTTQDLGDKLVINIPSPRHWFTAILQVLVLAMQMSMEFGIIFLLILLARDPDPTSRFFFFVFLVMAVFWTMTLALAIYGFLLQLFGKETILVSERSVTISRALLGTGPAKEYLAPSIQDLRLAPPTAEHYRTGLAWINAFRYPSLYSMGRSLAFDYGAKTFRFASGIDEAEGKQLLTEILRKFPQYHSGGPGRL